MYTETATNAVILCTNVGTIEIDIPRRNNRLRTKAVVISTIYSNLISVHDLVRRYGRESFSQHTARVILRHRIHLLLLRHTGRRKIINISWIHNGQLLT